MTAVLSSQPSVSGHSLPQITGSRRKSALKESISSLNSDMSAPNVGNDGRLNCASGACFLYLANGFLGILEDATITINKNIGADSRKSLE